MVDKLNISIYKNFITDLNGIDTTNGKKISNIVGFYVIGVDSSNECYCFYKSYADFINSNSKSEELLINFYTDNSELTYKCNKLIYLYEIIYEDDYLNLSDDVIKMKFEKYYKQCTTLTELDELIRIDGDNINNSNNEKLDLNYEHAITNLDLNKTKDILNKLLQFYPNIELKNGPKESTNIKKGFIKTYNKNNLIIQDLEINNKKYHRECFNNVWTSWTELFEDNIIKNKLRIAFEINNEDSILSNLISYKGFKIKLDIYKYKIFTNLISVVLNKNSLFHTHTLKNPINDKFIISTDINLKNEYKDSVVSSLNKFDKLITNFKTETIEVCYEDWNLLNV